MSDPVIAMLLSSQDRDLLLKALQSRSPDVMQARMANALLLIAEGLSAEDVAGLLYLDERTVDGWQTVFMRQRQAAA